MWFLQVDFSVADFLHDYKSTLQELVQTDKKSVTYEIISETGPAHDRTFVVEAIIDDVANYSIIFY